MHFKIEVFWTVYAILLFDCFFLFLFCFLRVFLKNSPLLLLVLPFHATCPVTEGNNFFSFRCAEGTTYFSIVPCFRCLPWSFSLFEAFFLIRKGLIKLLNFELRTPGIFIERKSAFTIKQLIFFMQYQPGIYSFIAQRILRLKSFEFSMLFTVLSLHTRYLLFPFLELSAKPLLTFFSFKTRFFSFTTTFENVFFLISIHLLVGFEFLSNGMKG